MNLNCDKARSRENVFVLNEAEWLKNYDTNLFERGSRGTPLSELAVSGGYPDGSTSAWIKRVP